MARRMRGRRVGRRRRRRFTGRVQRWGVPFRMTRKLTHVWRYVANPGAGGAIVVKHCSLNSINDPSGEMGSGQPLYHDQWTGLYRKYIVLGWRMKIEVVSGDNTNAMCLGFTPLVTNTYLANYQHYKEFSGTVSKMVTPDMDKTLLLTRGGVKRYLSPGSSMWNDDTVQGTVGGDPARLLYGHLWVQSTDQTSDLGQVDFVCTLTQIVRLFDVETVARS